MVFAGKIGIKVYLNFGIVKDIAWPAHFSGRDLIAKLPDQPPPPQ